MSERRRGTARDTPASDARVFALEGAQVRLEPMRPDHVEALLAAANEDRSTFGFTWVPPDRAEMTAYVERAITLRVSGEQVPFVTWSQPEERIVGSTRFYDLTPWDWSFLPSRPGTEQREGRPDAACIGYTWLCPSAQRSGVNTEAKLLMMTCAFEHWAVRAVRFLTDARNERSRAAIARLGCTLDGVLRADRPAADGTVRDFRGLFDAGERVARPQGEAGGTARRVELTSRPTDRYPRPGTVLVLPLESVPLHLWVQEPPPSPRNRLTCAIRLIMVIPQLVVLLFVNIGAFFAVVAAWFVALFTGRLDGPLREFIAGVLRWNIRVEGYFYFLTDEYSPFSLNEEENYPVRLAIPPPVELNRAAVLFRIFIAIPAGIVANVLGAGLSIVAVGSWFMLLVTGELPGPLFEATRAVIRYQERFYGYLAMLTPEYSWGPMGDDTSQLASDDPNQAWSIRLSDGGRTAMIVVIVLGVIADIVSNARR